MSRHHADDAGQIGAVEAIESLFDGFPITLIIGKCDHATIYVLIAEMKRSVVQPLRIAGDGRAELNLPERQFRATDRKHLAMKTRDVVTVDGCLFWKFFE